MGTTHKASESLAKFLEALGVQGWEVRSWEADMTNDPIYLGCDMRGYAQYGPGIRHGEIRVQVVPKPPAPKPFARKLRRYDVRQRKQDDGGRVCDCYEYGPTGGYAGGGLCDGCGYTDDCHCN